MFNIFKLLKIKKIKRKQLISEIITCFYRIETNTSSKTYDYKEFTQVFEKLEELKSLER